MCDVSNFETKPSNSKKNSDHAKSTKDKSIRKNQQKHLKGKQRIQRSCEKEFICPQCKTNFKDFQSIVDHNCKPFKCVLCSKEFLHDFQLKWHECCSKSTEAEEFFCDFCESIFETSELLSEHRISCNKNLGGECVGCNKKLFSNFHEVCEDCKLKSHKTHHKLLNSITKAELQIAPTPETVEVSQNGCTDQLLKHPTMSTRRRFNGSLVKKRGRKNDFEELQDSQVQSNKSDSGKKSYINGSSICSPTESLFNQKIHFSGKFKASKKQPNATSVKEDNNDSTSLPRVLVPKLKPFSALEGKTKKLVNEEEKSHDQPASDDKSDACSSESLNISTRQKDTHAEAKSTNKKFKEMKDIPLIEVTVSGNCKKSRVVNIQKKKEDILENNSADPKKEIFSKSTFSQKIAKLNELSDDRSSKAVKRNTVDDVSKISFKKKKNEQEYSKDNISDINLGQKLKKTKRNGVHKSADSVSEHSLESEKIEKSSAKYGSIKANLSKSKLVSPTSQINHQKNSLEKKRKCVRFSVDKKRTHSSGNNSILAKNKNNAKAKQEFQPPKENFLKTTNQRTPSNSMHFNGFRLNSENQKKKPYAHDKNQVPFIFKNIPRLELEVTKSTLSAIPDDINRTSYPNSKETKTERKSESKNLIEIDILCKALPPKSGFLLKVFNSNIPSFRCSKCNKLFPKIKSGASHYDSCNSRLKKKMLISLDEVIIFCTICHFHCSILKEIFCHRDECFMTDSKRSSLFSQVFQHYENASKNFICTKCGYSCLSNFAFNQHPCEKRLSDMAKCTVTMEKLKPKVLNSHYMVTKFECSSCKSIFYDDITFKKHAEIHSNDGVKVAKVFIDNGKTLIIKQIKRILKKNQNCETSEELMEKVITPIAKLMESVSDTGNLLPELNLDLILPGAIRKLIEDLCQKSFTTKVRKVLSNKVEFLNIRNLFGDEDDDDDEEEKEEEKEREKEENKKTDPTHAVSNAKASAIWESYKCNCEKEPKKTDDPDLEEKPCLKCLHKFMNDYSLPELTLETFSEEIAQAQNSEPKSHTNEETAQVQNSEPKSHTNEETDVSKFLASIISSSDPSSIAYTPPSCDSVSSIANTYDTTATSCTTSHINTCVDGLFNVSQQSNSYFPSTSGCDSSSTVSATTITNLDESMEMMSPYYSNNYSTDLGCSPEFSSPGVYLNEKEVSPNEMNTDTPVTSSRVIQVSVSELSEMLHSNSASDISSSLSLDLQSKDNIDYLYSDQNYQQPQSITLDLPFPFKDVNLTPFMDSSNEGKTPNFPTSLSPSLEQAIAGFSPPLTPADDSIKLHTCIRDNASDCSWQIHSLGGSLDSMKVPESSASEAPNFEKIMHKLLYSGNDVDLESFEFNLDSVLVKVHFTFNEAVTYSAYLLKEEQHVKYVCASCVLEYPVSDLIQHLIHEHKENNEINMFVS